MGHEIVRLNALPDGRFVRVYVRTNKIGSIEKNKQLADERGQAVTRVLRGVVSKEKLPEANLEVVAGRHDKDGVDAQGAWIEVYKPRQNTTEKVVTTDNELSGLALLATLIGAIVCIILGLGGVLFMLKRENKNEKDDFKEVLPSIPQTFKGRLESIPAVSEPTVFEMCGGKHTTSNEPPVVAEVIVGDQTIVCMTARLDGILETFHNGASGVFITDNVERWQKSVVNTLRRWLNNESGYDFSLFKKAINDGRIVRVVVK
jgi:hypothetical protein